MPTSTGGTALPGFPKLKDGEVLTAFITHVDSSRQFYVQDKESASLVGLINMWGRQAESLTTEKLTVERLITDSAYLLKSPIDDKWYRATLTKTDPRRKYIRLYLADFSDMVDLQFSEIGSRLLPLGVRSAAFPPMAILCIWDAGVGRCMAGEFNKNYVNTRAEVTIRITSCNDSGAYHVSLPEFEGEQEAAIE